MKHATDKSLDGLENLLTAIRTHDGLREKKRGIFYRKSKAFLHFHENSAGLFADIRIGDDFRRFAVNTDAQRKKFTIALQNALAK